MRNSTLRNSLLGLFAITAFAAHSQNVAVNISGNSAYTGAILDLSNHNTTGANGFLPPYVSLSNTATQLTPPITGGTSSQLSGLLVYNTSTNLNGPGLYYWYYNSTTPANSAWIYIGNGTVGGTGTVNYLARWTPNTTTLSTGITQDNGVEVGIQTGAYAFTAGNPLLQVTANTTNINAIEGITSIATGAGIIGSTSTTGVNGYGVKGLNSSSVGGGTQYAVYGLSTATAGNSFGVYGGATGTNTGAGLNYGGNFAASGSPMGNYGTYSSATGASTTNYGGYFTATGGTNNYAIIVPNAGGSVGLGTLTPARELEIAPATNTARIDGLKGAATFNVAPAAATTYMVYANTNGDLYSMPASGANNNVLTWTATGPSWQPATTTSITANNGCYISATNNVQFGTNPLLQGTTLPLSTYTLTETSNQPGPPTTNYAHQVQNSNSTGTALAGINTNFPPSSGTGIGVFGQTYQSNGYGIYGINSNPASGTGIYGQAITYGVYGTAATGVYGFGTNIGVAGLGSTTGVSGTGTTNGVLGTGLNAMVGNSTGGTNSIGGEFTNNGGLTWAYAAYYDGTSYYGIYSNQLLVSTAGKSTVVEDTKGDTRLMYCSEAPELLFQDFGTASLVNGKIHIDLDPIYAKNVAINEKHPLRVIITMNDECPNSLYVTNRTATGFDVVEMNHGISNSSFTYEVIANRADDKKGDNGASRNFSSWRFQPIKVPAPPIKK